MVINIINMNIGGVTSAIHGEYSGPVLHNDIIIKIQGVKHNKEIKALHQYTSDGLIDRKPEYPLGLAFLIIYVQKKHKQHKKRT